MVFYFGQIKANDLVLSWTLFPQIFHKSSWNGTFFEAKPTEKTAKTTLLSALSVVCFLMCFLNSNSPLKSNLVGEAEVEIELSVPPHFFLFKLLHCCRSHNNSTSFYQAAKSLPPRPKHLYNISSLSILPRPPPSANFTFPSSLFKLFPLPYHQK